MSNLIDNRAPNHTEALWQSARERDSISQQHDIAAPLWEAEAQIAIALARLSKLGPGGLARYGWAGSWADYQKIAQLLCKTRALAERIEHRQRRIPRNDSNAS